MLATLEEGVHLLMGRLRSAFDSCRSPTRYFEDKKRAPPWLPSSVGRLSGCIYLGIRLPRLVDWRSHGGYVAINAKAIAEARSLMGLVSGLGQFMSLICGIFLEVFLGFAFFVALGYRDCSHRNPSLLGRIGSRPMTFS